jgi:hypothetical protein
MAHMNFMLPLEQGRYAKPQSSTVTQLEHAIDVALGIGYLWINSLCVGQDEDGYFACLKNFPLKVIT